MHELAVGYMSNGESMSGENTVDALGSVAVHCVHSSLSGGELVLATDGPIGE